MKLYIETENGQVKNHPALEENLIQAFGSVPAHWEPFVRVKRPVPNVYDVLDNDEPTYQKIDGVWKDVWALRPMTDAEKFAKQKIVKDDWAARDQAENWSAWTFNEDTCSYVPPVPRPAPEEGKIVFWCGSDNEWKEAPAYPADNGQYKFDFFAWVWVPAA